MFTFQGCRSKIPDRRNHACDQNGGEAEEERDPALLRGYGVRGGEAGDDRYPDRNREREELVFDEQAGDLGKDLRERFHPADVCDGFIAPMSPKISFEGHLRAISV